MDKTRYLKLLQGKNLINNCLKTNEGLYECYMVACCYCCCALTSVLNMTGRGLSCNAVHTVNVIGNRG